MTHFINKPKSIIQTKGFLNNPFAKKEPVLLRFYMSLDKVKDRTVVDQLFEPFNPSFRVKDLKKIDEQAMTEDVFCSVPPCTYLFLPNLLLIQLDEPNINISICVIGVSSSRLAEDFDPILAGLFKRIIGDDRFAQFYSNESNNPFLNYPVDSNSSIESRRLMLLRELFERFWQRNTVTTEKGFIRFKVDIATPHLHLEDAVMWKLDFDKVPTYNGIEIIGGGQIFGNLNAFKVPDNYPIAPEKDDWIERCRKNDIRRAHVQYVGQHKIHQILLSYVYYCIDRYEHICEPCVAIDPSVVPGGIFNKTKEEEQELFRKYNTGEDLFFYSERMKRYRKKIEDLKYNLKMYKSVFDSVTEHSLLNYNQKNVKQTMPEKFQSITQNDIDQFFTPKRTQRSLVRYTPYSPVIKLYGDEQNE